MIILLTGASGFIGQALVNEILKTGSHELVLLTTKQFQGIKSIPHGDYSFTKQDFYNNGVAHIDVVIHLGAFIPKSAKEANDINRTTSNIQNTLWLLNNLPSMPSRVIFISSTDVYGKGCGEKMNEETPLRPDTLYGWSKVYCEILIKTWCLENGVDHQILRLGHIYGPGEEAYSKLIPVTIRRVLRGENPRLFTIGEEKRSFLYIDDCVRLINRALDLTKGQDPINIVSSQIFSIRDIVGDIIKLGGRDIQMDVVENVSSGQDLIFENNKMQQYLGVEITSFQDGIRNEYLHFLNKES